MIYVVMENSNTYSQTIKTIMTKLGELNYEIADPKFYDFKRTFSNVIMLNDAVPSIKAHKIWHTKTPDTSLSVDEKKSIFAVFKEAVEYDRKHGVKKEVLNTDVPRFADLKQFLESFKGQVVEFKLPDGRYVGIYSDEDRLAGKYPNEYHVSTILNLSRLQDIFGFTRLSVKDL